ncbi:MAG: TonB-dependent receptor [Bacteroidales bacterium]|nr:TonB-dependent receptor [Bacteroidales bacterium]
MRKILFLFLIITVWVLSSHAQEHTIKGVVVSAEDNGPLVGVSILVKGTTSGTVSDREGKYELTIAHADTVIFSYVGFLSQEHIINSDMKMDVLLEPEFENIEQVYVIGYGTQKKSDITGSVISVSSEKITQTPVSGIDQALQGRASGVMVTANSGQPGSEMTIRVRGIGTVNNSSPLYVVDGVLLNNINYLNPNDIQSIEILKDASAAAIYGSRGANGVILVTTRKGAMNKMNTRFEMYTGIQNRWNKLDLMNREQYAAFKGYTSDDGDFSTWVYNTFNLSINPYIPADINYENYDTDWQDVVFKKNARISNYYLSFDGGNENSNYAISLGYFDQEGIIISSNYKRFTFRVNSSHELTKYLEIGENISLNNSKNRGVATNNENYSVLNSAISLAPWDPVRYPDGRITPSTTTNLKNPLSMVELENPHDTWNRIVGNVYADITLFPDLIFRSNLGTDVSYGEGGNFKPEYYISANDNMPNNFLEHNYERYTMWLLENTLTYKNTIALKHDVTMLIGMTAQESDYDYLGGSKTDLPNESPNLWYLDAATQNPTIGGTGWEWSILSYLGRINYVYNNKYLLTFNIRRDGSSRFGKNNKWGSFPSLALGWKLSEEEFFHNMKEYFNSVKIRGGWGRIGNQEIGNYAFTTRINAGTTFVSYVFGDTPALATGAAPLSIANNDIKWETTEQTNAGIDISMLNNKLSLSGDYYIKDTKDMLVAIPVPGNVGLRQFPFVNAGSIRNQGFEFSAEFKHKVGNLFYTIGGNFATLKNEVLSLGGGEDIYEASFFGEYLTRTRVGDPVGAFYGYQTNGIFQDNYEVEEHVNSLGQMIQPGAKPGDFRFVNQNDDNKIDQNDKINLGNPYPSLTYGFYASAEYKGFDLQLFFQGVYGNKIFNCNKYFTQGTGYTNLESDMVNAWSGKGSSNTLPDPEGSAANLKASSRYIEDGSYLRLKNTQLGYTFNNKITGKAGVSALRIYVSGTNLLTFTKYTGFDPEIGYTGTLDYGVDRGTYPQARTFIVGLTLNL